LHSEAGPGIAMTKLPTVWLSVFSDSLSIRQLLRSAIEELASVSILLVCSDKTGALRLTISPSTRLQFAPTVPSLWMMMTCFSLRMILVQRTKLLSTLPPSKPLGVVSRARASIKLLHFKTCRQTNGDYLPVKIPRAS